MEEFFDVVDEGDRVVGRAMRSECHRRHLLHRSVMFFVFDRKGRVFVNKRSGGKEFYGGFNSIVFGGHVPSGETYDAACVRELHEEAGLSDKPFRLGYFKKRLPTESENVMVYCVVASKKPKLLKEEVVSGSFKTLPEVEELVKAKKFIPETRDLLPILRKHLKKRFNN